MGNGRHLLTARRLEGLSTPGRYADGGGLYLWIREGGSRQWIVRVQKDGRRRDFGLGGYPRLSLASARTLASALLEQVALGLDPLAVRDKAKACPTLEAAAIARHAELAPGLRNSKHAAQWLSSLRTYAFPSVGSQPVDRIDASAVRDCLLPIWLEKPETARWVHQRVVDVLVYAAADVTPVSHPAITRVCS
jgi:hypothetical protein